MPRILSTCVILKARGALREKRYFFYQRCNMTCTRQSYTRYVRNTSFLVTEVFFPRSVLDCDIKASLHVPNKQIVRRKFFFFFVFKSRTTCRERRLRRRYYTRSRAWNSCPFSLFPLDRAVASRPIVGRDTRLSSRALDRAAPGCDRAVSEWISRSRERESCAVSSGIRDIPNVHTWEIFRVNARVSYIYTYVCIPRPPAFLRAS